MPCMAKLYVLYPVSNSTLVLTHCYIHNLGVAKLCWLEAYIPDSNFCRNHRPAREILEVVRAEMHRYIT